MFARVQIEHEIDQSALQSRPRARKTNESAAAEFRRAFQIEESELCSKRNVIFDLPA